MTIIFIFGIDKMAHTTLLKSLIKYKNVIRLLSGFETYKILYVQQNICCILHLCQARVVSTFSPEL